MTIVFPLDVCSCSLQLLRFGSTMAYNCVLWQMIRTRLQVQATNNEPKSVTSSDSNIEEEYLDDDVEQKEEIATEQARTGRTGIKDVVVGIWKQDGIRGFYRALSSQLLCIFVSDMVYFFAVTLVKQRLYGKREVDAMSNLKASSLGPAPYRIVNV